MPDVIEDKYTASDCLVPWCSYRI